MQLGYQVPKYQMVTLPLCNCLDGCCAGFLPLLQWIITQKIIYVEVADHRFDRCTDYLNLWVFPLPHIFLTLRDVSKMSQLEDQVVLQYPAVMLRDWKYLLNTRR